MIIAFRVRLQLVVFMECGRFSLPGLRRRVSRSFHYGTLASSCSTDGSLLDRQTVKHHIVNHFSLHSGAQNKVVSVWIVDKRTPSGMGGGARWEAVVDLCRKDASALTRLKHPAIVKVCILASTHSYILWISSQN